MGANASETFSEIGKTNQKIVYKMRVNASETFFELGES
jgi:hypothetical protein